MKKKGNGWAKVGQAAAIGSFLLIGMICGVFIGEFVGSAAVAGMPPLQQLLWFGLGLVAVIVAMYVQIIVHEAGHLCGGLWSGYRFSSFRIGSFMWVKEGGRLHLRRLSLAGTGGQCIMIPPDMVDGRIPFRLFNLGGSLMNLVTAAVCWLLSLWTAAVQPLSVFFALCAVIGAGFALVNGIPLRLGTINNDGYNALELGKDSAALHAFWLQLRITEQTAEGVRLKDMPAEWFALPPREALGNTMVAAEAVFRENWLMDALRFDEAKELIDSLLADGVALAGVHRSLLVCDRITLELMGERDEALLQSLCTKAQKKFMKQMRNFPTVLRTEYAYARLHEHDSAEAERVLARFRRCGKTHPYAADIQGEEEIIARIDALAA